MRKWGLVSIVLALLLTPPAMTAGAAGDRVYVGVAPRQTVGRPVSVRVWNRTTDGARLGSVATMASRDGTPVATHHWSESERDLEPSEVLYWDWDQRTGCSGDCPEGEGPGERVPAGRYVATVSIEGVRRSVPFTVGAYFRIGFEGRDETFVAFVATDAEVRAMSREARSEDKTLIVSGLVRAGSKRYNPDWGYTMGSHSIELGEVFAEVCDASPGYVQRHLDEWDGQRWCPWSSYVARRLRR